jgi:hypothetical protein
MFFKRDGSHGVVLSEVTILSPGTEATFGIGVGEVSNIHPLALLVSACRNDRQARKRRNINSRRSSAGSLTTPESNFHRIKAR